MRREALAFGGVIWCVPLICVLLGVKAHEGSFGKAASDVHCAQLNTMYVDLVTLLRQPNASLLANLSE